MEKFNYEKFTDITFKVVICVALIIILAGLSWGIKKYNDPTREEIRRALYWNN